MRTDVALLRLLVILSLVGMLITPGATAALILLAVAIVAGVASRALRHAE